MTDINTWDKGLVFGKMFKLCWVSYALVVVIKIFGFGDIPLYTNNEWITKASKFIETNEFLYIIVSSAFLYLLVVFVWKTMLLPRSTSKFFYFLTAVYCVSVTLLKHISSIIVLDDSAIMVVYTFLDLITMIVFPRILGAKNISIIITTAVVFVSQCFSVVTRSLSIVYYMTNENYLSSVLFTLDINILNIIFFLYISNKKGGVTWEFSVYSLWAKTRSNLLKLKENLNKSFQRLISCWRILKTGSSIKRDLLITKVVSYALIFGGIIVFSLINEKIIECAILFVSFVGMRYLFPVTYHTHVRACTIVSVIIICFAVNSVITISVSILSAVIIAFIVDIGLYKYEVYRVFSKRYETDFTKYGLTTESAKIAYQWKVLGLKDKQILELNPDLTPEALTKRKNRINKAIKNANVQ